ncbi:chemotaxis protein [Salmonella enterica subsp. enterica serovar Senftenberg]|nr:chemotaxis protein [Salmonella enterica subsp. enterica serovar Senftenberg]EEN1179748.1 chemotaxis protein [Salmonella enterica subsp. enterica serovar Senftenberg]
MSGTNKIVTSTVNEISWITDDASYQKAKKKIISLKAAHEKPAKALETAQKRTAQTEGKAALAAARAQTQRLKMAQKLSLEQQRQAQAQAKIAKQEEAHARKMQALNARGQAQQLADSEQIRRRNSRLAAISAKVQAAARSRAMTYNPDMGGNFAERGLLERQNAAMLRGHGAVAADIAATKKAMTQEEKRQREKEASLKREVTYYNSLRRSALTLANVNGVDVATRYKAISAAKEALKAQKEERYTVEETRFEMARITTELRKQARLQQRITREQKAAGVRAGRVRTEGRSGRAGLAAAGVIGGASLVGSMGIARANATLQGSVERNQQMKALQSQGVSRLEYEAVRDVVANKTGFNISPDKMLDLQAGYRDKVGQLTANGVWKTNQKGETTLSGAGELGDLINAIAGKSNVATAKRVVKELDKLDFNTAMVYLVQLSRQFKFSSKETAAFAESINDASKVLPAFVDGGDAVQKRMDDLARNGYALSDAQQEQLNRLGALSIEYSRISNSLSDTFSSGFISGLGEYAANTDNLSKGMAGLIPITNELGKSLGEMSAVVLKITSWFGGINPENKHEQLSDNGLYYKDSMVGRVWQSFKNAVESVTSASTIPGVQGMPSQGYGSGTAFNNPALALNVPGLNYQTLQPQQPTFTVPTIDSLTQRQPIPVAVTGQANINQQMDVFVHDDKIAGLVDTKIRENNQAQNNLILGIAQ